RRGTSRAERGFTVAHENFLWLSERASRGEAVAEQRERMLEVVSEGRPWEYIEAVYLTGTIEDVQRRIQQRVDQGVEHLFLHTMTADLAQLDLFAQHILGPSRSAVPAAASRP